MIEQADSRHPLIDGQPRDPGRGARTLAQGEPAPTPTVTVAEKRSTPLSLSDRVRSLKLPDQPKQARSQGSWFPWLLCLLLGGISGYLGYRAYTTEPASIDSMLGRGDPSKRRATFCAVCLRARRILRT